MEEAQRSKQAVDIIITNTAFSIVRNNEEYLIVSVNSSGQLVVAVPKIDDVDLVEDLEDFPEEQLEINVRHPRSLTPAKMRDDVPEKRKERRLRRIRRPEAEVVTGVSAARPAERVSDALSPLDELIRDEILGEILKSLESYPGQPKDYTAEESHRIAKQVLGDDSHTNVMRVAGFRAALTRGAYDERFLDAVRKEN